MKTLTAAIIGLTIIVGHAQARERPVVMPAAPSLRECLTASRAAGDDRADALLLCQRVVRSAQRQRDRYDARPAPDRERPLGQEPMSRRLWRNR